MNTSISTSVQIELGNTIQVTETQALNTFLPAHPVGNAGDAGLVHDIFNDYFTLLLPNGEFRSYSTKSSLKILDLSSLNLRLKKLLNTKFKTLISKGSGVNMGSDPECFVLDQNGTVIPAWDYLPQTPDHKPATQKGLNYLDSAAFYDGVQAEFTTIPALCLAYHVDSIQNGLKRVLEAARKINPLAQISCKPVVEVPESVLSFAEETYVMLGCAPSQNIYPDVRPIYIENPRALGIRFAGGHIHFGMEINPHLLPRIVKNLDSILAVIITAALDGLDDCRRRSYYGRAGEFRLPPHGLEYRTLSSAVLYHPALVHLAFDLGRQTVWTTKHGISGLWQCSEQEAREAVDNSDYKLAKKIVRRNLSYLRAVLMAIYDTSVQNPAHATNTALRLILEGARNLLPDDMEQNWKLSIPYTDRSGWIGHSEQNGTSVTNLNLQEKG